MKSFSQLHSGIDSFLCSCTEETERRFQNSFFSPPHDVQLIFFACFLVCAMWLISFEYVCAVTHKKNLF